MEYEFGNKLVAVGVGDLDWVNKGEILIFQQKSTNYEADKGIWVLKEDGTRHCINEIRVATFGDKKAIENAEKNAPKMYVVLQDSCNNFQYIKVGLDKAVEKAIAEVPKGEEFSVYELKAVKKISGLPTTIDA